MIAVDELGVRYAGAPRQALTGVSLTAPRGRITAVVGPNGSGKSTLVRALLGSVPRVAGRITLDEVDVATLSRRMLARRVAFVTQREEALFPLRVRDYVALGRYAHLGPLRAPSRRDAAALDRALGVTETAGLAERTVAELSGGEWQRIRLARALAQEGDAIVLDEPTTFLDVAHEMAVFELLAQLAEDGLAILLVSHQLNLVARFADHLVLLHEGRVAASGPPAAVMTGEVLEPVYGWPLLVTRDLAVGAPALVPLRVRPPHRPS